MSWRRDWVVVRTVQPVPSEQGIFALSTKKTGMIRQGCSDASSICEHFQRLTIFQLTFLLFAQTGAEFAITGMKFARRVLLTGITGKMDEGFTTAGRPSPSSVACPSY